MRAAARRTGAVAVLAACVVPLLAGGAVAAPDFVGVNGSEYNLSLSRLRVDPGRVTIEFVNQGEDAHNLLIKRRGAPKRTIADELGSGLTQERTLRLRRDTRYRLWCSLTAPVDHDLAGMNASLRVRNR
jgi:plastocyanin